MESLRDEPAVAEEDVIEIATRPDVAVVEAQSELNDAADEVVERETAVAELSDAADNLETYRAVLEQSLEENGMDRAGAAAVQVGLDSTLSRIGTRISTPAMEAYGTASNRIQATRLTIEAISDKIKEIWEAIKQALRQAWEAVKKFVVAVFNSVERLRQTAEKVKAAAGSATGTPSEAQVDAKGAGAKLNVQGAIPADWVTSVNGGLSNINSSLTMMELTGEIYQDISKAIDSGDIASGSKTAADAVEGYMTSVARGAEGMRKFGGKAAAPGLKIPGVDNTKVDLSLSPMLPGNAVFYVAVPKKADVTNLQEAAGLAHAGFYQLPVKNEVSDSFKTLSGADMAALADSVLTMCQALDSAKATIEKTTTAGDTLIQAGDRLLQRMANESEEAQAQARSAVQALPRIVEGATGWSKPMVGWYVGVGGAAMKVCQASLAAYKNSYQGTENQLPAPAKAQGQLPAPEAA
jgi:hypothetical protein